MLFNFACQALGQGWVLCSAMMCLRLGHKNLSLSNDPLIYGRACCVWIIYILNKDFILVSLENLFQVSSLFFLLFAGLCHISFNNLSRVRFWENAWKKLKNVRKHLCFSTRLSHFLFDFLKWIFFSLLLIAFYGWNKLEAATRDKE